jgi:hypothetical protein
VSDAALGGEVSVHDAPSWTRPVTSGVFQGLGADYVTVVKDGAPKKSRRGTIGLQTFDVTAWNRVSALVNSGSTLVYRDPFGSVIYFELTDNVGWEQLPVAPLLTDNTPLRHAHSVNLQVVEVAPPVTVS